jgi:hypothetical protein
MRIDHLVYGTPDRAAATDDLEARFGVRAQPAGRHPGIGTHNPVLALGPRSYLEVIAPDPEQPQPCSPRPFGLDELTSARRVGWAVGCDDIDVAMSRARDAGYDPGDAIEMMRTRPTGTLLRWRLTLNAIAGGPVPFRSPGATRRTQQPQHPKASYSKPSRSSTPNPTHLPRPSEHSAADIAVKTAGSPALVAHIRSRDRTKELRDDRH